MSFISKLSLLAITEHKAALEVISRRQQFWLFIQHAAFQ